MGLPFVYPVDPPSGSGSAQEASGHVYVRAGTVDRPFLGYGLLTPFRRDQKGDFAAGGGELKVKSSVAQILGTDGANEQFRGELLWRDDFGSLLFRLRHRNNDEVAQQLASVYVRDALERWEPRIKLKSTTFTKFKSDPTKGGGEDGLIVSLRYDIIKTNVPGNQVLVADVRQDVRL